MQISYRPYQLKLKHPFTISGFSRTATPLLLLEIKYQNYTGYGEASMVPYLGETIETATAFLNKIDLNSFNFPFKMDELMAYLDDIAPGLPAIKAAIDIALHDLSGKILDIPCYKIYGAHLAQMPLTSYTLGIDEPAVMLQKANEAIALGFKILKIKLGSNNDKLLINTVRQVTNLPLYVDANQGWQSKHEGLEMVNWLASKGVVLVEQPMLKTNTEGNRYITQHSPIPIIADEAVQRLADVAKAAGSYHGINIKLMKAGGMYEAHLMLQKARQLGLKVMIGCMSETSIATLAAAALAPLCDFVDLDGPFLTTNNPYKTPFFLHGKYILNNNAGLGLIM
ncbi:MAG: dipeptide epimerase [Sphingobacteriales bacterium]|nr:MAG: dipeptide epimerase [Sphingobacteriales bacterium]TAF83158.1 MAG: dipeptide epimerase [Sphingobacteriales bacterium]